MTYAPAGLSASELYLEAISSFASGRVRLPDHALLLGELRGLERRVRAGGKDQVSHPPSGHDDLANAIAA